MGLEIKRILEKFLQVRILVIGDVMVDRYWWGKVTRISPEAPVPVVNLEKESLLAGGAANVGVNIKGLGATAHLVGVIGHDIDGINLSKYLEKKEISSKFLVSVKNRPTTVKTRIMAQQQQIARIDHEVTEHLSEKYVDIVWKKIESLLSQVDVIVISDYDKGLLTKNLLTRLITSATKRGIKVIVDPKGDDYQKYQYSTILTPNQKEALEYTKEISVRKAGIKMLNDLSLESLLITQGEDGMTIFKQGNEQIHLKALARHVYDVTGAGDTVLATLAVALGAGADLVTAAKIANVAAGFVVEEVGTTSINIEKLYGVDDWS